MGKRGNKNTFSLGSWQHTRCSRQRKPVWSIGEGCFGHLVTDYVNGNRSWCWRDIVLTTFGWHWKETFSLGNFDCIVLSCLISNQCSGVSRKDDWFELRRLFYLLICSQMVMRVLRNVFSNFVKVKSQIASLSMLSCVCYCVSSFLRD